MILLLLQLYSTVYCYDVNDDDHIHCHSMPSQFSKIFVIIIVIIIIVHVKGNVLKINVTVCIPFILFQMCLMQGVVFQGKHSLKKNKKGSRVITSTSGPPVHTCLRLVGNIQRATGLTVLGTEFSPNNVNTSSTEKVMRVQNDHVQKKTLILCQIPPTNSLRKCMKISLENESLALSDKGPSVDRYNKPP